MAPPHRTLNPESQQDALHRRRALSQRGYLHDGRDKDGGFGPLQENVGEGLKDGIRDVEDGQGGVELRRIHVDVVEETGDFGISNVGSVKEANEVEQAELYQVSMGH